jgi:thiol-disulfide isomerase/thioredoxin
MKKILFFTAPWCAGCKTLKPQLEKLTEGSGILVEEIDVEERGAEAEGYGVTNLPTLFFVLDEELVGFRTGASQAVLQYIQHFVDR